MGVQHVLGQRRSSRYSRPALASAKNEPFRPCHRAACCGSGTSACTALSVEIIQASAITR
jgi:hypothetical protein